MPSWKKVITSGSNAVLHNITSSGDFEISGNISGSSTSTGSFGKVFANGTIHGKRGSSGATVHPSADEAIFENSANAGISILSGNSNEAAVYFGDSDDNDVGRVRYDHSDNTMDLITGAAVRATVAATKTTFTQTQGIELINTGNNTVFHIPSSAGYTFGTQTNNHMSMWTNNTERIRILNSGNVGIGTATPGVALEVIGSVSGSSTSTGSFGQLALASFTSGSAHGATGLTNHGLPFYEEGEFTVTVAGDGSGAFSAETGEFTRIGRTVHFRIGINVSSNFTSNKIGGLPYPSTGHSASPSSLSAVGVVLTSNSNDEPIVYSVNAGAATLSFFSGADATDTHLPNTTNDVYRLSGTYFI